MEHDRFSTSSLCHALLHPIALEGAANVLSFLLQSAYSGRAELGLIGDENLSLKVSPDGSNWLTALTVDRATAGLSCIHAINGGPLGGFRNMLRNGAFRVWQRGASFSTPGNGQFFADGWAYAKSGSGEATTVSRVAHPSVPGRYGLRFQCSVVGTLSSPRIRQHLEGVGKFEGQSVTISFDYVGNVAGPLTIRMQQNFGTGGSPSAAVNTNTTFTYANTAGALARACVTIAAPTIVGMTLGANGDDYVSIEIFLPAAACDFQIFDTQAEVGATATPFEDYLHRPLAVELMHCKRTFERIGGAVANTHFGKGYADSTTHAFANLEYTEKRAVPTVTVTGGATDCEVQRQGSAAIATTALTATVSHIGLKSCQLDATVASGLAAGEGVGIKAKTVNGYIDISAEL